MLQNLNAFILILFFQNVTKFAQVQETSLFEQKYPAKSDFKVENKKVKIKPLEVSYLNNLCPPPFLLSFMIIITVKFL